METATKFCLLRSNLPQSCSPHFSVPSSRPYERLSIRNFFVLLASSIHSSKAARVGLVIPSLASETLNLTPGRTESIWKGGAEMSRKKHLSHGAPPGAAVIKRGELY